MAVSIDSIGGCTSRGVYVQNITIFPSPFELWTEVEKVGHVKRKLVMQPRDVDSNGRFFVVCTGVGYTSPVFRKRRVL